MWGSMLLGMQEQRPVARTVPSDARERHSVAENEMFVRMWVGRPTQCRGWSPEFPIIDLKQ